VTEEANIQTVWTSVSLTSLLPPAVIEAVDALASASAALVETLDFVATALDTLADFLVATTDVVAAAIQAALGAVDAALEFFEGTQLGIVSYVPQSYRQAPNCSRLLTMFGDSMVDETDPERPYGESEDNHFLMWVGFAIAPNISELQEQIEPLLELFRLPISSRRPDPGESYFDQYYEETGYPPELTPGEGRAPDWGSTTLAEIGVLGEVVEAIRNFRDTLTPAETKTAQVRSLIRVVQKRVAAINSRAQAAVNYIAELSAMLVAAEGLHVLNLFGTGSVASQRLALIESKDHPDFPLSGPEKLDMCAGIVLHVQAGDGGTIRTVRNLFGLGIDPTDEVAEIVEPTTKLRAQVPQSAEVAIRRRWSPGGEE